MKRLYTFVAICVAAASCNLDLVPENAMTYSNAFLTEKDLNTTTSSIHFYLGSTQETPIHYDLGAVADELAQGEEVRNWSPIAIIGSNTEWMPYYNTIFMSNLLLENIGQTKDLSDDRRNYHRGQALFAKGFSYFRLSQKYGKAVVTTGTKSIQAYPLSSMLEVVNAAISAGEEGYQILPIHSELRSYGGTPVQSKQFASKGSCAALLAHAYAWRGSIIELFNLEGNAQEDYQKSIEYASKLIDGAVGNYTLLPSPEELCQHLSKPMQANPEDIFIFEFDRHRSGYAVTPTPYAGYVSWPVNKLKTLGDIKETSFRIYKSTAERMYPDAEDQRRNAFFYEFDTPHTVDGNDYAIMYKYREALYEVDQFEPDGVRYRTLDANYNYWRLADIILLRAECLAKLNRNGEAINDINTIRNRAGAKAYPAPHDTSDVRRVVFLERERELLAESDFRFFDVIRNNYFRTDLNGKFKVLTPAEVKDGALFLPIPVSAYKDKGGQVLNTLIIQGKYWSIYM